MRPWPLPVLLVAASFSGGCGGLDTGEQVGAICDPGEEVFCRCQNGASGTRTCGDEGGGFEACRCDDEGATSGDTGGSGSGGGGGDAASGGAAIGSACTSDQACASGICEMGFCTVECAARAECPDGSACVRFEGSLQACLPECSEVADCDAFGQTSTCSWASAVDGAPATVCANWSTPALPPIGSPCSDHVDCQLGQIATERACDAGACVEGCAKGSDCPAGSSCVGAGQSVGTCS